MRTITLHREWDDSVFPPRLQEDESTRTFEGSMKDGDLLVVQFKDLVRVLRCHFSLRHQTIGQPWTATHNPILFEELFRI